MWFKCDQLFVVEERCLMTQKQLRGKRGGELLDDTKTAERETGRRVA